MNIFSILEMFTKTFFLQKLVTECDLTIYHTISTLMTLRKKSFENIERKGENAGNQHFLLFPQYFLKYQSEKSF